MSQGDLKALGHPQQLRQATSESESEKVVRSTAIAIDVHQKLTWRMFIYVLFLIDLRVIKMLSETPSDLDKLNNGENSKQKLT